MRTCLGTKDAAWCNQVADRCARLPGEHWRRLTARSLAELIERDAGYLQAWSSEDARPTVQRYILCTATRMQPLPLGLDRCHVPHWPHTAALARWLGVPDGGMWRLTRPASWQRRTPLGQQHYRYRLMAKRRGGWRLLEEPQPYLMALQRRLLDDLLDRIPPHQAACGYARERSVLDHAQAHSGRAVVLKFDLQDFFASVRASRVHALFATLGYSDAVARELAALCTTATPEPVLRRMHEDGQLSWLQLQRLRDPHLPQGAPSSPALANLCAFRFDLRLDGLAHAFDARYTRYADDIVLSGGTHLREALPRIETWIARIAIEEGYTLNHRKTQCLTAARRQSVCSIVVNRHPNLPRDEFDRLKAILHGCATQGPAAQNREARPDWREHLRGRVAWAEQINPRKAQRLRRLYEQIDWSR
ncbi:MAG TPA: reverse transcriptase family protein [Burkholderiaceae bacterium]|nr:reverse transcriptase family protein [Burkholderiaceae bacterium]